MGDINVNGDGNNTNNGGSHVEQNSTVHKQSSNEQLKKSPFYKEWWFVSLVGGLFAGVGTYFWLGNVLWSLGVALLIFVVIIFFNPKRRFFRVGLLLLSIGGSTFLPIVNKLIGKYLGINLDQNPWIGGLMIVVACVLFVLDYFENKN